MKVRNYKLFTTQSTTLSAMPCEQRKSGCSQAETMVSKMVACASIRNLCKIGTYEKRSVQRGNEQKWTPPDSAREGEADGECKGKARLERGSQLGGDETEPDEVERACIAQHSKAST